MSGLTRVYKTPDEEVDWKEQECLIQPLSRLLKHEKHIHELRQCATANASRVEFSPL